jgi:hypothetical protein
MSYQRADGLYVHTEKFALPSTVITANGVSAGVDVGEAVVLRSLLLTASALSGGASLVVSVQTGPDNSTWTTLGAYTAITANGTAVKSWSPLDRWLRLSWANASGTVTLVAAGDLA